MGALEDHEPLNGFNEIFNPQTCPFKDFHHPRLQVLITTHCCIPVTELRI